MADLLSLEWTLAYLNSTIKQDKWQGFGIAKCTKYTCTGYLGYLFQKEYQ